MPQRNKSLLPTSTEGGNSVTEPAIDLSAPRREKLSKLGYVGRREPLTSRRAVLLAEGTATGTERWKKGVAAQRNRSRGAAVDRIATGGEYLDSRCPVWWSPSDRRRIERASQGQPRGRMQRPSLVLAISFLCASTILRHAIPIRFNDAS